ncbi:MAG: AsmA family protein [Spirochaetia bacterium]|nr:AsmA family protein [Spirochaetia bacterium]
MKKVLVTLLVTAAVLAALVIAAAASVPLWLPQDKLKEMLVRQIEDKTGRDAQIASLEFSLFKGIELKGIRLKEAKPDAGRDFIRDDEVLLKYNLFALFTGRLVIHKFELMAPYVSIVRDGAGAYNFSDIVEGLKKPKKQPAAGDKAAKKGFIKDVVITSITVKNGFFSYADHSKPKPLSVTIKDFNLNLEDLILSAVKPVGLYVSCTALYDGYTIPVTLRSNVRPDMVKKQVMVDIENFSVLGISSNGRVKISDFRDISGRIFSTANTKKIIEILPEEAAKKITGLDADIALSNTADFTYIQKKLKFTDTLAFNGGGITYKEKRVMEGLTGTVKVDDNYSMRGSVSMLLAGSRVKIKAEGTDINSVKNGIYKFDIYSPKFASEYLLAMFPKKSTATAKTAGTAVAKTAGKKQAIAPGVYINIEADRVTFKDIEFGKTVSAIKFVKGRLYADTSARGYDGTLINYIEADINTEKYSTDVAVKKVKVNRLISDAIAVMPKKSADRDKKTLLDDMQDKVYGEFDMKASFSGEGFKKIAETIKGAGNFRVSDGYLKSLETGRDLSKKIGAVFLEKDIPFDELGGDFTMAAGKINVKNFVMQNGPDGSTGDMKVKGNGWMTVDSKLDVKLNIDFSPKVAKQVEQGIAGAGIKDASYAYEENGWLPFDLRIYNTIKDKKYDYTQKRLINNIKRNLGKKIEKEAGKFLEENAGGLMKNLFGK